MASSPERRSDQRYLYQSTIDLYRKENIDHRCYAQMVDCSDKGLSLMTNEKLVLGELVYVELKHCDTNPAFPLKKNYSGIVRWGKRYASSNADADNLYKYGIELGTCPK